MVIGHSWQCAEWHSETWTHAHTDVRTYQIAIQAQSSQRCRGRGCSLRYKHSDQVAGTHTCLPGIVMFNRGFFFFILHWQHKVMIVMCTVNKYWPQWSWSTGRRSRRGRKQIANALVVLPCAFYEGTCLLWMLTQPPLQETEQRKKKDQLSTFLGIKIISQINKNNNLTCVSRPKRMIMIKKQTDHSWGSGIMAIAWGYAINARPGPGKEAGDSTREAFI